jgi:hypothetical protein
VDLSLLILILIDLVERSLIRTIILLDVPPRTLEKFTTNIQLAVAALQMRIMSLSSQLSSKRNNFIFTFSLFSFLSFSFFFFLLLSFLEFIIPSTPAPPQKLLKHRALSTISALRSKAVASNISIVIQRSMNLIRRPIVEILRFPNQYREIVRPGWKMIILCYLRHFRILCFPLILKHQPRLRYYLLLLRSPPLPPSKSRKFLSMVGPNIIPALDASRRLVLCTLSIFF